MRLAREYPNDYEHRIEAMRDRADIERKRRRENPGDEYKPSGAAERDPKSESRFECEREEAAALQDTEPGRWGDHASPARMRRDIERDREEDRHD